MKRQVVGSSRIVQSSDCVGAREESDRMRRFAFPGGAERSEASLKVHGGD